MIDPLDSALKSPRAKLLFLLDMLKPRGLINLIGDVPLVMNHGTHKSPSVHAMAYKGKEKCLLL